MRFSCTSLPENTSSSDVAERAFSRELEVSLDPSFMDIYVTTSLYTDKNNLAHARDTAHLLQEADMCLRTRLYMFHS